MLQVPAEPQAWGPVKAKFCVCATGRAGHYSFMSYSGWGSER